MCIEFGFVGFSCFCFLCSFPFSFFSSFFPSLVLLVSVIVVSGWPGSAFFTFLNDGSLGRHFFNSFCCFYYFSSIDSIGAFPLRVFFTHQAQSVTRTPSHVANHCAMLPNVHWGSDGSCMSCESKRAVRWELHWRLQIDPLVISFPPMLNMDETCK